MSKYEVEFEDIEACMIALGNLENARIQHGFDEWPKDYIEKLRTALEHLFDSAEIV